MRFDTTTRTSSLSHGRSEPSARRLALDGREDDGRGQDAQGRGDDEDLAVLLQKGRCDKAVEMLEASTQVRLGELRCAENLAKSEKLERGQR
jgi:hypothetical protein